MLGSHNAIWDDGEWISWDEINAQIQYKEWGAKYPNADRSLVPFFEKLITLAEDYFRHTGKHLQVCGDIEELFAAITLGIKLNGNYAQESDGRLGNDRYEVETIAPFKKKDEVLVKRSGNFNKLFIAKINEDFEISYRVIDRKNIAKGTGKYWRVKWPTTAGQ